jgi:ATP-dependent Clp protease ATP-binding subunit ClpC
MFERYDETARRTLFFARWEASQVGRLQIEPAHILLGLLRDKTPLTRSVFARAGLSYDNACEEIRTRTGIHEKVATSVEIPFSQAVQRLLNYAMQEADDLHHTAIGTEHLLLAALHEKDPATAPLFERHGFTLDATRETIRQMLADGVQPSWHVRGESASPDDMIEAIKARVQQFGLHAKPGAQDVIARIVRDLDELKRLLEGPASP